MLRILLCLLLATSVSAATLPTPLGLGVSSSSGGDPTTLPLVQQSDSIFTFLGSFKAPTTTYSAPVSYTLASAPTQGATTLPNLSAAWTGATDTQWIIILSSGEPHTVTLTNGSSAVSLTMSGDAVQNASNTTAVQVYRSTFVYGAGALSVSGSTLYATAQYVDPWNFSNNTGIALGAMSIPTLTGAPAYDGSNGQATVLQSPYRPTTTVPLANYTLLSAPTQGSSTLPNLSSAWTGATSTAWTIILLPSGEQHTVTLTNGSAAISFTSGSDTVKNAGNTASVQVYMWVPQYPFGNSGGNGDVIAGTAIYNGSLLITGATWYGGTGQLGWIVKAPPGIVGSWGTANTVAGQTPQYSRYFAGQLGEVPSIWQPYLGGPMYLAGGQALSTISNQATIGPSLWTFDPATVSSSGAAVSLRTWLWYYLDPSGGAQTDIYPTQIAARSFAGPFPLAGGYPSYTITGGNGAGPNGLTGATTVTLASAWSPPPIWSSFGQICFSDSECRIARLKSGSTLVPSAISGSNDPVGLAVQDPSGNGLDVSSLTCASCTNVVTIAPMGDNYASDYNGPFGGGFIEPGSRTFLHIGIQRFGPHADPPAPCHPGASGSTETPVSPDTQPYIRLQVYAFDLDTLMSATHPYDPSPYAWWEFPGSAALRDASGCLTFRPQFAGAAYFDPTTSRLYVILQDFIDAPANGHMIVLVYQVNALSAVIAPHLRIAANDERYQEAA